MSRAQRELILTHLIEGRRITDLQALDLYKCRRLAARIYDLKQPRYGAHPIRSEMIQLPSGKHVAEYRYDFSVPVAERMAA